MLQMTEVKNPDEKMKEMKVWQFYVVVCLLCSRVFLDLSDLMIKE